jgi:hypothetical protein
MEFGNEIGGNGIHDGGPGENIWVSQGGGRGREGGQHSTPKYIIFFFMTLAY